MLLFKGVTKQLTANELKLLFWSQAPGSELADKGLCSGAGTDSVPQGLHVLSLCHKSKPTP